MRVGEQRADLGGGGGVLHLRELVEPRPRLPRDDFALRQPRCGGLGIRQPARVDAGRAVGEQLRGVLKQGIGVRTQPSEKSRL